MLNPPQFFSRYGLDIGTNTKYKIGTSLQLPCGTYVLHTPRATGQGTATDSARLMYCQHT